MVDDKLGSPSSRAAIYYLGSDGRLDDHSSNIGGFTLDTILAPVPGNFMATRFDARTFEHQSCGQHL